jgi:hypothetical protein
LLLLLLLLFVLQEAEWCLPGVHEAACTSALQGLVFPGI